MKEKRILFVIPSLASGGAEHQTINQINYLVELGYKNIYLLVLSNQCQLLNTLKLNDKFISIIKGNSAVSIEKDLFKKLPFLVKRVTVFCKANRITDIISILPMAHLVCRLMKAILAFSFFPQPCLNTYYRDVYYQVSPPNTFSKKVFNRFNSLLAYLFDNRTLFISQAVFRDIQANIFTRNPMVLPNSLPIRNISENAGKAYLRENNILDAEQYLILIPGRLHFKKGHLLFIKAFKSFVDKLKLSSNEIKVFIAGDGPMKQRIIESIDKQLIRPYFYLNGYTENTLLLSLFKCADLVVIPSSHEGFGNVAIEGLMQQSLMLVSKTGGLAEIVRDGENGFHFEPDDENALKEKLIYIYTNRYNQLIERGLLYKEFIEKYTLNRQIDKIIKFCELGGCMKNDEP